MLALRTVIQPLLSITTTIALQYKLAWPRKEFFLASICHAITDPLSRKSGHGLLLGCRSGFDARREKKNFFLMLFLASKNRETL